MSPGWATATRLGLSGSKSAASRRVSFQEQQPAGDAAERTLTTAGSVDAIEHGLYVGRVATAPLATSGTRGKPVLVSGHRPVMSTPEIVHITKHGRPAAVLSFRLVLL